MTRTKNINSFRPGWLSRKRGDVAAPLARAKLLLLGASATVALAATCGYGGTALAAPKLTLLYSFTNIRGAAPTAGLIADGAGNFYGTTSQGGANNDGAAFELSPPTVGEKHWTEKTLFSFNGTNGSGPYAGLIADGAGNLYGTAIAGGTNGCGVVFELSPPAAGKKAWTETVLFSFTCANGRQPFGGLTADGAGNLYGTTFYGGAHGDGEVFEVSPPAVGKKAWTHTLLFSFDGTTGEAPYAGLLADGAGNLYGTIAGGYGEVFELSPPAVGEGHWIETLLFSFDGTNGEAPYAGLLADGAGNLYGTTAYGGTNDDGVVFELSPPTVGEQHWTEKTLFSFNGTNGSQPYGELIADGTGNLYGTATAGGTDDDGVVLELSPPAPGKKAWTAKVLHSFDGKGAEPAAGLIADGEGNLYGTTSQGGANDEGVVFKLTP